MAIGPSNELFVDFLDIAMTRPRHPRQTISLLGAFACTLATLLMAVACGSGKGATGVAQYYGNYHPAGWIDGTLGQKSHGSQAVLSVSACTKCHEISILKVGNGVPTCVTTGCHHQARFGVATSHGIRAKLAVDDASGGSLVSCQICHGHDFAGGASTKACSTCHGVSAPHPVKPWRGSAGTAYTHSTADPSNAVVCAQCHLAGSPNNPAGHPSTPALANTQPGCYNATLCHDANATPHPVPFLATQVDSKGNGHLTVTAPQFAADCALCHAYSGTSPTSNAPLCNVCHQLANPTIATNGPGTCLSCHAGTSVAQNGPGGTAFPSFAGAHASHMALATALTCDSCHAGSGTGTVTHYDNANARTGTPAAPADVSISVSFQAKTGGAATFTPGTLTCSNVSCHGGQITPGWQLGTINTNTQCTVCHAVAASAAAITQWNDAFGRHSMGAHDATNAANSIACTTCHNMTSGTSPGATNHFKYMNTTAVDGVSGTPSDQLSSGTLSFDPAIVTGTSPYTVTTAGTGQGNGGCAITCHTHIHTGPTVDTWQSTGAPHQVPFYSSSPVDNAGNGHMTVTSAQFTADCVTCHAHSGTSPLVNAPRCNVCHKLGDPSQTATGAGTCLSCHIGVSFSTVGPTGASYPNAASAHPKHLALPTTLTCDSCHQGVGTLSQTHYDNANYRSVTPAAPAAVAIVNTFKSANGGAQSFSAAAFTCSNISCHGGKLTPSWQNAGSINSTLGTDCVKCHAVNDGTLGAVQYNDAVGGHAWGTHKTAATADCSSCHAMNNGSQGALKHFAELDTTPVDSAAKRSSGTVHFASSTAHPISGAMTYDVTAPYAEGDGGCALTCHSTIHVPASNHWNMPKGSGVAHHVPFYKGYLSTAGYSHQAVTTTQFNAECINCHDLSGTSSKSGPTCAACHLLASPVTVAAGTGTGIGTCLSCHVNTNGGMAFTTQGPVGGSAWPNLPRAHVKHTTLSTFTRGTPVIGLSTEPYPACAACHTGFLPGEGGLTNQAHYDKANTRSGTGSTGTTPTPVAIHATFNAKASTASAASSTNPTCSAVSCHGGITTPAWSGTLPAVTSGSNCTSCHANRSTSTQYNDARGSHTRGEHPNVGCLICHDMNPATNNVQGVTNHYNYLDTTVAAVSPDQRSIDTIKVVIYNGTTITTGVVSGGTIMATSGTSVGTANCALTCHTPGGSKTHSASDSGSWSSLP